MKIEELSFCFSPEREAFCLLYVNNNVGSLSLR